jgi:hypothetical protein
MPGGPCCQLLTKLFDQKIRLMMKKCSPKHNLIIDVIIIIFSTLFEAALSALWQHCRGVWIEIAESFPSHDVGKITKGLAH